MCHFLRAFHCTLSNMSRSLLTLTMTAIMMMRTHAQGAQKYLFSLAVAESRLCCLCLASAYVYIVFDIQRSRLIAVMWCHDWMLKWHLSHLTLPSYNSSSDGWLGRGNVEMHTFVVAFTYHNLVEWNKQEILNIFQATIFIFEIYL